MTALVRRFLNVKALLKGVSGKSEANELSGVTRRFLQVFRDHGVGIAQIPRLIPDVALDALESERALLAALTPKVLEQTAHLFGIRLEWLENVDDDIYEYRSCYKEPQLFFEHLASLLSRAKPSRLDTPLRVLTVSKKLNCHDDRYQLLVPILVEPIAELGDESVYRYHAYTDGWDWGYAPSRIQLKAMARMVFKALHMPVPLFQVSAAELQAFLIGECSPENICMAVC